jgi:hypothetical protein
MKIVVKIHQVDTLTPAAERDLLFAVHLGFKSALVERRWVALIPDIIL